MLLKYLAKIAPKDVLEHLLAQSWFPECRWHLLMTSTTILAQDANRTNQAIIVALSSDGRSTYLQTRLAGNSIASDWPDILRHLTSTRKCYFQGKGILEFGAHLCHVWLLFNLPPGARHLAEYNTNLTHSVAPSYRADSRWCSCTEVGVTAMRRRGEGDAGPTSEV